MDELDRLLERQFHQKIPLELTADLESLATVDPNGMSFRYTTVKSKHGVSWAFVLWRILGATGESSASNGDDF